MFTVDDKTKKITMNEGDFGLRLPINIKNSAGFNKKLIIYNKAEDLITKNFEKDDNDEICLELTKDESNLLKTGKYYWRLYLYSDNEEQNIMVSKNTIVKDMKLIVKEGA